MFVAARLGAVKHQMYSERRSEMNPAPLPLLNSRQLLYRDRAISEAGSTHTHTPLKRDYIDTLGKTKRE